MNYLHRKRADEFEKKYKWLGFCLSAKKEFLQLLTDVYKEGLKEGYEKGVIKVKKDISGRIETMFTRSTASKVTVAKRKAVPDVRSDA